MMTSSAINWQMIQYRSYSQFIDGWDWHWYATLTFPSEPQYGPYAAKKMLLRWTRNLCTDEHIQVGYFYVLCKIYKEFHVHLLMIGTGNIRRITLRDVCRRYWEGRWPYLCKIELPESNIRVSRYVARHIKPSKCHESWFDVYNMKLLKNFRGLAITDLDPELESLMNL